MGIYSSLEGLPPYLSNMLPINWLVDVLIYFIIYFYSLDPWFLKTHKRRRELWEEMGFLFYSWYLIPVDLSAPHLLPVSDIHFQKSRNTQIIPHLGLFPTSSNCTPKLCPIERSIFTVHPFSIKKDGRGGGPTFYLLSINSSNWCF